MGKGHCFLDKEVETRKGKVRHLNVVMSLRGAERRPKV